MGFYCKKWNMKDRYGKGSQKITPTLPWVKWKEKKKFGPPLPPFTTTIKIPYHVECCVQINPHPDIPTDCYQALAKFIPPISPSIFALNKIEKAPLLAGSCRRFHPKFPWSAHCQQWLPPFTAIPPPHSITKIKYQPLSSTLNIFKSIYKYIVPMAHFLVSSISSYLASYLKPLFYNFIPNTNNNGPTSPSPISNNDTSTNTPKCTYSTANTSTPVWLLIKIL